MSVFTMIDLYFVILKQIYMIATHHPAIMAPVVTLDPCHTIAPAIQDSPVLTVTQVGFLL